MRKQNGITLIALVITIIVLMILTGVSISLVLGENGVLDKAQNAVTEAKKATALEEAQLVLADWKTEYLINKTAFDAQTPVTTASGVVVMCTEGNFIVIDDATGKIYTTPITEDGTLESTFTESFSDDTNSQVYKAMHPEENIPDGYVPVGSSTWDEGFVIVDNVGNEFVWVPVMSEANYAKKAGAKNAHMTKINELNHGATIEAMVKEDQYGTNSWLEEKTEAELVNEAGGFYVSRYEVGIASAERTDEVQSGWTPETIVSKQGAEPVRNITQAMALELANTWKTSDDSATIKVQSGLITGTQWDVMCNFIGWSTCDSDCTSWGNYLNSVSRAYTIGEAGHSGIDSNYIFWYTDVTQKEENHSEVFATGMFESITGVSTAKKNIYDAAGNLWEWTTEIPNHPLDCTNCNDIDTTNDHHVLRGGGTVNNGYNDLVTFRNGVHITTHSDWLVGFRVVLYVK